MTIASKKAFVVAPDEGARLHVLGHEVRVRVSGRDTAGEYYTYEVTTLPGGSVPPHVHRHEDEVIAVLEGEFRVWLDGASHHAVAGSVLHFPRGVPHAFENVGSTAGRTLWTIVPGANFEAFFEELAELPAGPPDMERVSEIFARYGMDILPP